MTLVKKPNNLFPDIPSIFDDFRNFMDWPSSGAPERRSVPAVNVKETEAEYELEIAAPGLHKDDFDIKLENNILTISSESKTEHEESDKKYARREFHYTSFSRSFTLPENEIDEEKINANYKDGVLYLVLPKRDEVKPKEPRTIHIK